MVENHIFPRQEIFSHTLRGTPWINFEWLSQIILYLLVKAFGLTGILYGKMALGFFVVGLAAFLVRRHGARGPALLLFTMTGFFALRPRLYERVELASLVCMPLFVLGLSSLRNAPLFIARKIPWILAALMVLWCNLHGGFIYGAGLALLMAVGARLSGEPSETVRFFDRTVVLVCAAMLLTPFGIRLAELFVNHALQLTRGPQLIEEWAPTSVRSNPSFWILFLFAFAMLLFETLKGNPAAKFWAAPVLLFAFWGSQHQRNAAYSAFLALPFLSESLSNRWPSWLISPLTRTIGWAAALGALSFFKPYMLKQAPAPAVIENHFPIGACEFIQKNNVQGSMFNTYHLGGYIEWALGPSHPVFMDGRYLFQPLLVKHIELNEALTRTADGSAWKAYLEAAGVDHAIVDYTPPVYSSRGRTPFPLSWQNLVFPRSDWALVYWDDAALFFLKRTPTFASLIAKFEYKVLWPYNLDLMQAAINGKKVPLEQVERELERHASEVEISYLRLEIKKRFSREPAHVA